MQRFSALSICDIPTHKSPSHLFINPILTSTGSDYIQKKNKNQEGV